MIEKKKEAPKKIVQVRLCQMSGESYLGIISHGCLNRDHDVLKINHAPLHQIYTANEQI